MEERSKTNKQIYEQKYPTEALSQNPMLCAEAMGYLKALKEYFPSGQTWIEAEMTVLMLTMILYAL